MKNLIKITKNISYYPAKEEPLSSDVVFIKTKQSTWIYDVGSCEEALDQINRVEGSKNIVISHFHFDHSLNLMRVKYDNLYVSKYTKKCTLRGTVLKEDVVFDEDPEIQIIQIPSSHAKGCLGLLCGDYCFLGDATYCKEKKLAHSYNAQLLKEEIQVLEKIPAKYFCLSHDTNFIQKKEDIILHLKSIYYRRNSNDPEICVEDFFNPDGSVKDR